MHVLIATDGSPSSLAAAHKAGEILRAADRVTLVSVLTEVPGDDAGGIEGSVYSASEQDQLWKQEMAEAGEEIEELKSPAQYRELIGGSSGAGEGV